MNNKPIMKNSKKFFIFLVCLGLAMIAAGIIAGIFTDNDALSGRLIGCGAGFGSGIVGVAAASLIRLRRKPEIARQQEINENDERLIKIREKSAMDTWYLTLISLVFGEFICLWLDYMIPMGIIIGLMAIHVFGYFILLYNNSKKL